MGYCGGNLLFLQKIPVKKKKNDRIQWKEMCENDFVEPDGSLSAHMRLTSEQTDLQS